MAKVASIHQTGGPEVIGFADVVLPPPGPGEARLRHTAIGVNFIDTYHRNGLYPLALPSGLGVEAVGVVEAVGEGVTAVRPGDRCGYFGAGPGAYAEERNLPAELLLPIPDRIPDDVAAAAMLKGCTAEFLVERCARVQPGWTVLVQAAAGGVGLFLVQWLKAIGATVIGTVGSADKAEIARKAGADHVILYREEDPAKRVRAITNGEGVPVVFDGVGHDTWEQSLDSTAFRGLVVSYGNASGPVTGVALGTLNSKGSLYCTRPTLFHYYRTPDERRAGIARLWQMVETGHIEVTVGQRWPLAQVADAHRALESRATTGSTILVP